MTDICGTCTLCCRLPGIAGETFRGEPFEKPMNRWCPHCEIGQGCTVYEERPQVCRTFQCLYHSVVSQGAEIDPDLRPDRCGVIFGPTTDSRVYAAFMSPDRPDTWRNRVVMKVILNIIRAGGRVILTYGPSNVKTVLSWSRGRMVEEKRLFTDQDEQGLQNHVPGIAGDPRMTGRPG